MRLLRMLAVIGLAAYLVLQGLFLLTGFGGAVALGIVGIIGLITGVLIFVSLGHWFRMDKADIKSSVDKENIFNRDKDRHAA